MGESKEKTEIEKAEEVLQKIVKERGKKCAEEIKPILDKWGFNLQPVPTDAVMREFIKLISLCNVTLVSKRQGNNGDNRDSSNKK